MKFNQAQFSERIKSLISEKFGSQEKAARAAGVSLLTIQRIANGKPSSRKTLYKLCDAGGFSADYILGLKNEK